MGCLLPEPCHRNDRPCRIRRGDLALVVAGLLSYLLYYYAPAMLGMKTGYPLYVVGSSTFGTAGGYLMPGLLMGVLQIGWFAVGTWLATTFILKGVGSTAEVGSPLFTIITIVWGYTMAYIGAKGIQYVAKVSLYLNIISFLMVLIVFAKTAGGIGQHTPTVAPDAVWRIHAVDRGRDRFLRDRGSGRRGLRHE